MAMLVHESAGGHGPGWDRFFARVRATVMEHPVVADNPYCAWFAGGAATRAQVRDLVQQFSVFSNLFIVAQLMNTITAPTLPQPLDSKQILVNELAVVFRSGRTTPRPTVVPTDEDE